MALKETLTPLKATNNATYRTVEGVTYFKLKSEFEGDYTKHCGLLGEEIDENFYFLRGYDIESITVDENRNLIINRVDKDYAPLVVNIGEELGQPEFKFNEDEGVIVVTYPDGTTSKMEGFLVEGKDIRIATDSTLDGNGTIYNPLRISPVETTGTFAPADKYFDITDGSKMPKGEGKGYRIVTKEKIDNFGCLYPFSAVQKIQEELTASGSQWRVPTKKDWDELLNAFECAEDRNHNSTNCTWLGNVAGRALKSFNFWNEHKTLPTETPTYGEDAAGLSVYPLGLTPDRNSVLDDKNYDAEGFGKIGGMWANTLNNEGNAYVKMFAYNTGKVDQDTYGEGARMSIRLVKDYAYSNYKEIENILGFPYPTEMVYGPHEDNPYVKIWTKINLYSDADTLDGIRSEEWDVVTDSDRGVKVVYFINEWDGTEWHKKPLEDGDSVIIINYEDKPYHEWRIIDGELIDTAEALVEEFKKDFEKVEKNISELSATTKELVEFKGSAEEKLSKLNSELKNEIDNRIKKDDEIFGFIKTLETSINDESKQRENDVNRLKEAIELESNNRENADNELNAKLKAEAELREAVDNDLKNQIFEEEKQRKEDVENLKNDLNEEAKLREEADDVLKNELNKEREERVESDNKLHSAIEEETKLRENEDVRLQKEIDVEKLERFNNDITPGTYTLLPNEEMEVPTNSEEVENVKIKVSDDFFNFGEF